MRALVFLVLAGCASAPRPAAPMASAAVTLHYARNATPIPEALAPCPLAWTRYLAVGCALATNRSESP